VVLLVSVGPRLSLERLTFCCFLGTCPTKLGKFAACCNSCKEGKRRLS